MTKIFRLVPCLLLGLVFSMAAAPAGSAVTAPAPAQRVQDAVPSRLLVQRLLEDRVLALTNVERRKRGCAPLRSNAYLRKSARGHTVTMALNNLRSHQLPGERGEPFGGAVSPAGLDREVPAFLVAQFP